ncbi:MAG: FAD-dependent oxidoreductase [Hyphomicrobiaceae bacterium]|nr:FAD-dependent oxidoreductase [Hyphomicrobiaceae bacterium]
MTLASRGHDVCLREAAAETHSGAASRVAGAMLAPYCESESAEPIVQQLGLRGLELWQQFDPTLEVRGTLVLASQRDKAELDRYARMTEGHEPLYGPAIPHLEPLLGERFQYGLYFPDEAHMAPRNAIDRLIGALRSLNVDLRFSSPVPEPLWLAASAGGLVIDCRGLGARSGKIALRGVRGEMAVVYAPALTLTRPIRFLHPRFPIYIVPWGRGLYMIGATMIESESHASVTIRSTLELMTSACRIHPWFLDARVTELSIGVRPAFDDNIPKIGIEGKVISVNGAYRHGFLLAPALAEIVADHLEHGLGLPKELVLRDTYE